MSVHCILYKRLVGRKRMGSCSKKRDKLVGKKTTQSLDLASSDIAGL